MNNYLEIPLKKQNLVLHGVSEKTVQNCFCQNFVKFPSIVIIFGRYMAKWLKLYVIYPFPTSPHLTESLMLSHYRVKHRSTKNQTGFRESTLLRTQQLKSLLLWQSDLFPRSAADS